MTGYSSFFQAADDADGFRSLLLAATVEDSDEDTFPSRDGSEQQQLSARAEQLTASQGTSRPNPNPNPNPNRCSVVRGVQVLLLAARSMQDVTSPESRRLSRCMLYPGGMLVTLTPLNPRAADVEQFKSMLFAASMEDRG